MHYLGMPSGLTQKISILHKQKKDASLPATIRSMTDALSVQVKSADRTAYSPYGTNPTAASH